MPSLTRTQQFKEWRKANDPDYKKKMDQFEAKKELAKVENDTPELAPTRDAKGHFVKGHKSPGPGRTVGYKLRLAELVNKTVYEAFEKKGKEVLERAMSGEEVDDALAFMKLVVSMLPKQVQVADDEGHSVSFNAVVVPAKVIAETTE